jgi:hypothetical protein
MTCQIVVIPAKAGTHSLMSIRLADETVGSRFRGNDCGGERSCR